MKENKKAHLLVGVILFLGLSVAQAQSPFATLASNGVPETVRFTKDPTWIKSGDLHNAWLNLGVSNQLRPEAQLNRAITIDGSIVMNVVPSEGGLNLSVVTDMSLQLEGQANQARVGLYPWIISSRIKSGGTVLLYGGLCYEVLPEKTLDTSPQFVKAMAGAEGVFPIGKHRMPGVFSANVSYEDELRKNDKNRFHITGICVIPLMPCISVKLSLRDLSEMRAGIIVNLHVGQVE